jgi:tRNA pseudouridine synthase 10
LASVSAVDKVKELLLHRLEDNYVLCNYCLHRQVSLTVDVDLCARLKSLSNNRNECNICSGLMHETDSIIQQIRETLSDDYQFDTFLIGATLPANIFEIEDQIRARFKIRGRENIKSQLIRYLRKKFSEVTKKQIDILHPDLTISLQFQKNTSFEINIKMRPLIMLGRYIKKNRGIPQRSGGEQNNSNGVYIQSKLYHIAGQTPRQTSGICSLEDASIQSIISKEILRITKGEALKFSWIGSEDENSLVLGSGRPFFVQIRNPKTIHLNQKTLCFQEYGLFVNIEKFFERLPEQPVQFIAKTRIVIQTSRQIGKEEDLKIRSLANSVVVFQNQKNKSRSSAKRIYSIDIVKINNKIFELDVIADGGLAIKQFVEGQEYMSPNISAVTNLQCKCLLFDILDTRIKEY